MTKVEKVKKIREVTGLGLADCLKALVMSDDDFDKAVEYAKAHIKPSHKPVGAGAVFSYVHHNRKIGVLLELHCGTDFVSQNEDFQKLGGAISGHIAAMDPKTVDELLSQTYVKDDSMTMKNFIDMISARFNEPIKVARFTRYLLGVSYGC